jgi:hypothetical protein
MLLSTALFLASCSKDGDDGKTMLTRTTKEAAGANCTYGGTKFETGIDANNNGTLEDAEVTTTQTKYVCDGAGAIYSSWIDVNLIVNPLTIVAEKEFYYKQSLTATALTADVVNKGIVLMYYKDKSGMVIPVERDDVYEIQDVDAAGNTFYFTAGFVFKTNYISFLVDASDFAQLNDNGSAVRYVVVPGNVAGRSVSDLAKLPYSEVAKLYNIQD